MNILVHIVVFLILVFLFLHIKFQLKTNNNLEIYEIDYTTPAELQTAADVRLPIVFDAPADFRPLPSPAEFNKQQNTLNVNVGAVGAPPIALSFSAARELVAAGGGNLIHQNGEFLRDGEFPAAQNDHLLAPDWVFQKEYDYIVGGAGAALGMRYHIDFRRYYFVAAGSIKMKFAAWKAEKYLGPARPMGGEFVSGAPATELDKIHFIDIVVPAGKIVFVPPYCWYSIECAGGGGAAADDDGAPAPTAELTILEMYSYRTIMNMVAISPVLLKNTLMNGKLL